MAHSIGGDYVNVKTDAMRYPMSRVLEPQIKYQIYFETTIILSGTANGGPGVKNMPRLCDQVFNREKPFVELVFHFANKEKLFQLEELVYYDC